MKRLIALILAVFMCYSMPAISGNADTSYEEANEAYSFLNALGIVESISENQMVYFETPASRGDFVRYAMLLGGYDVSNMNYTHSFYNDVSVSDKNFKYISCAYELGFVSGKGDFMFSPQDNISYNEAIKLIVCVLGANRIAKSLGGYPAGYVLAASKLGIKQNSVSNSNALTNGDVMELLYDALFAHTAFDNGEDVVIDYSDSGLVLEKCHNVKKLSGVVKSAGGIALTLDSGIETDEDKIIVGSTKLRYSDNPRELLGMYADVYYKTDQSIATAVYVDVSDNEVTVIESEDFVSVKNSTIEYTETDMSFETKYKDKTIKISANCDVVYNGKPYPFYDDKIFDLSNCNGSIVCISGSKRNSADVVIVEAYSNYVVASVDKVNKLVYSKLPKETLDFSEFSDVEVFDAYGNKRSFDDIFAADVISVMKSVDNKYAKIITSSARENRKVIEKLSDNKVILDNQKLAVFDFIARKKAEEELLLGRLLDICYDYKGRICDFLYTDYEDGIDYGYLIKVGGNTSGLSSTVKVKLFRLTDVMEEYFVAEKLKLDGDKVSNKDFYERFVLTDSSNDEKYTDMQMIKFSVDKNTGEINYIDSKYLGENEKGESLTSITHTNASFSDGVLYGLNSFDQGYQLTIPIPDRSLPPSAVNDMPDWLYSAQYGFNSLDGTFEVVDADEAGYANIVIYRRKWLPVEGPLASEEAVSKVWTSVGIVDEYVYTLDASENVVVKLTYYDKTGAKKNSFLRYDDFIKKPVKSESGEITYENMQKGDLFSYKVRNDYIYEMALCLNLYDIRNEKFFSPPDNNSTGRACGVVYGATNNGISLLTTLKEGTVPDFSSGASCEEIFDFDKRFVRTFKNISNIVIYDVKNEIIRKGSVDEIIDCNTDDYCPSIVYESIEAGGIAYAFVINNYR